MDNIDPIERERQAADRRYNDALTALDRELNAAATKPTLERDYLARLTTTQGAELRTPNAPCT